MTTTGRNLYGAPVPAPYYACLICGERGQAPGNALCGAHAASDFAPREPIPWTRVRTSRDPAAKARALMAESEAARAARAARYLDAAEGESHAAAYRRFGY